MTALGPLLYAFQVPGLPVAKGRARSRVVTGKTGKAMAVHYTPAETRNFESLVAGLALQARNRAGKFNVLETGPLDLVVLFKFPIPDSWPAWKRTAAALGHVQNTKKPDCSNLVKAIEDALNGVLWKDDGQVVGMVVDKAFAQAPGVEVRIYQRGGIGVDGLRDAAGAWSAPARAVELSLGQRLRGTADLLAMVPA